MNTFFRKLKIIVTIDKMPFYGVARGRNTGVFLTWQVEFFQFCSYKYFMESYSLQFYIETIEITLGQNVKCK